MKHDVRQHMYPNNIVQRQLRLFAQKLFHIYQIECILHDKFHFSNTQNEHLHPMLLSHNHDI